MQPGRAALSPSDYVAAAVAFADEHGLGALTMRSLGEAMGVDPTAVYRHFANKEALVAATLDAVMAEVLTSARPDSTDPRDALMDLALTARRVFEAHPTLAGAIFAGAGDSPQLHATTRRVVDLLERLGLEGDALVEWAQTLEAYVIGSTVFDLLGAPDHYEIRRLRYRQIAHRAFDERTRSATEVGAVANAAFVRGMQVLIDAAAASATGR